MKIDLEERVYPGISANYLVQESLSRYLFFKKFLVRPNRVLDIGCGVGYGTNFLFNNGLSIYGLDKSEASIIYARGKYRHNVTLDVGDANNLPYPNNYFDAICSFEVIEHLSKPYKMLKEVRRVLKNSGHFVISTPNRVVHSPKGIMSPHHLREYDIKEFKNLLNMYFSKIILYGQFSDSKTRHAYKCYLKSQGVRQKIVDFDVFSIRKHLPRIFKEQLWVKIGRLFGRSVQDKLLPRNFPIIGSEAEKGEYLIAVCQKSQ